MKRLMVWGLSLLLALVLTFIIFEYTAIAIPFVEGGIFTLITVILMTVLLSIPLDIMLKANVYDERGLHLGLFEGVGPVLKDDSGAEPGYQPIVSRAERLKQEKARK